MTPVCQGVNGAWQTRFGQCSSITHLPKPSAVAFAWPQRFCRNARRSPCRCWMKASSLTPPVDGLLMDNVRLAAADGVYPCLPCSRCSDPEGRWDVLGGHVLCPTCIENLALGDAEPLALKTDRHRCAICYHLGTLTFRTFPLQWHRPAE